MDYKRIVTHPGQAHRDDFTVCCIAMALFPSIAAIFRREPTQEDLDNPEVLVLDVGGQVDPEKGNFDHHQLPRDAEPCCALTLFLAHMQLLERFRLLDWVTSTEVMDSKGPFELAKKLGCSPDALFKNMSPIEGALVEMFEKRTTLPVTRYVPEDDHGEYRLTMIMKDLGRSMLAYAEELHRQMEWLMANANIVDIAGVPALVVESTNTKGTQKYRDRFHPELGICLSWDDRGGGWSLYRFNDNKRVDFSRLKDDPAVLFSHAGGFIAKTREKLPLDQVLDLAKKAVITFDELHEAAIL